ncbi:MAG: aspartate-semialdehyde dehydrogenase [Armatimonadetes bacterium]|nr:aspartate-semialdehyde dehydrogenase [Armatimonadota bacterium]
MKVAVLGATGAVGQEFLRLFEQRNYPVTELKLLASSRSVGKVMPFQGKDYSVELVTPSSFEGVDVAFFSAGASRSREFFQPALDAGAFVVDNSSAFRMDPSIPLIVPEVNGHAMKPEHRLIANPNCTASILVMALSPLRKLGKLDRVIVSTYQSASGGGAAAMMELESQTRDVLDGKEPVPHVMPHPYAFNLFSHNTPVNELGFNDEEWKVMQETRKILEEPDLKLNVTCVRVPVMRAHSESVTIEFAGECPSEEAIREVLQSSPGVRVQDDRAKNHFPMPIEASGHDDVLVGRIRRDLSHPNAVSMFIAGDQLLKGAALNAVQIAEYRFSPSTVA